MSSHTIRTRETLGHVRLVRLDPPIRKRRPLPKRWPIVLFGTLVAAVACAGVVAYWAVRIVLGGQ